MGVQVRKDRYQLWLQEITVLHDVRESVALVRVQRRVRTDAHVLLQGKDVEIEVEKHLFRELSLWDGLKQVVPDFDHVIVVIDVAVYESVQAGEETAD